MKENKKNLVTFKISSLLKHIGYNEACIIYYDGSGLLNNFKQPSKNQDIKHTRSTAPHWSTAMDWLRENKGIEIEVFKSGIHFYVDEVLQPPKYQFVIDKTGHTDNYLYISADYDIWYENYYDAREQAVLKAIELIKK
jgi:hypothetical protein